MHLECLTECVSHIYIRIEWYTCDDQVNIWSLKVKGQIKLSILLSGRNDEAVPLERIKRMIFFFKKKLSSWSSQSRDEKSKIKEGINPNDRVIFLDVVKLQGSVRDSLNLGCSVKEGFPENVTLGLELAQWSGNLQGENGAEVFGEQEQCMLLGKTEVKRIQQSVSGFGGGTHFPQDKSNWEHCSGEVWVSRGNQEQPEFCSGHVFLQIQKNPTIRSPP